MTPEQITDLRRQKYNATVVRLHKVHPDLMVMRVRPGLPAAGAQARAVRRPRPRFWEPRMPGCQEETLRLGDETKLARRSYSISCSVLDDEATARHRARRTGWSSTSSWCGRPTGRGAGPDAAAVHAARGRPALPGREDHRRTTRSTRSSRTTRSCSWRPAPARRRTTTCSGTCCAASHRGRSCRPAVSATQGPGLPGHPRRVDAALSATTPT